MGRYTDPERNGYLMEAKACKTISKELERIIEKYRKKVAKEADRKDEMDIVLGYTCEGEIQNDYGWEHITEKQYERYLELFRQGQDSLENHEKTVNEITVSILQRIAGEMSAARREWEFCALTPKEQEKERKRTIESQRAWKKQIAEIQRRIGSI